MYFSKMKKSIFFGTTLLVVALFASCSDDSPTQTEIGSSIVCSLQENCSDVTLQDGFALIRSSGKFVELGTNSKSAKVNERPQMDVRFSYDFQLGKHEVTCGEFNNLMGGKKGVKIDCENDSLPAVNVTYYDAILFANAKSKKAGFDTAYTYSSAEFDKDGHCILLNGFAFKNNVDAFRLPTEAEWVLAASISFNAENSWNAGNSNFKAHKVCLKEDENGLCDMAGNVTEWVNDWLGYFRDTTITDYVGAPDGGTLGQRIVKGGSFHNEISAITLYARGDVYTVTSSTRADYVGFRVAFGAIPNAVWMGNNGMANSSVIVPLASSAILRSFSGSYKVKLALRNDVTGNLAYIDYSSGILSVVEIEDSIDVYHPEISPDGKYVAFCTGLEGLPDESSVYVRDLNAEGSNLVKLDVPSAAIPRWRVLKNGDTVIVYVTNADNNESSKTFKSNSTWQVKFSDGKFGKPTKLFDGAFHGGISDDDSLTVTGARLLRARFAMKNSNAKSKIVDTVWYGGNQACNASLNKMTKQTLFLDFSGATGEEFVGSKYRVHERLFIMNDEGKLVSSIGAPSGWTFDHSEWVLNNEDAAVVTLVNADGAHRIIALLNTKDGSMTTLVEGDELWHPCLWVDNNVSATEDALLDLDSAGVYFVEGEDWEHEVVGFKMSMLWKYKDDVEILCVGSSRIEDGVAVKKIQSGYALNMGHPRNDMNASLYIAENYGLNHLKKLKTIVVSLDLDLWQNTTGFSDLLFLDEPGFVYDKNHSFWKGEEMNHFADIIESAIPFSVAVRNSYAETRGWQSNASIEWGQPLVEVDTNWSDVQMDALAWNLNRLSDFVKKMGENHINVVAVVFPQNPKYRNTGAWGRYGPRRSVAEKYLKSVAELAKENSNFTLFDENKNGDHDYSDKMALNTDHLSSAGAEQLTSRLDSLLKTLYP